MRKTVLIFSLLLFHQRVMVAHEQCFVDFRKVRMAYLPGLLPKVLYESGVLAFKPCLKLSLVVVYSRMAWDAARKQVLR